MTIVHIQEIASTQVTEITAGNVEMALKAYARNACANWHKLIGTRVKHYHNSNNVFRMVAEFDTERLIIRNIRNNLFVAQWLDQN